MAHAPLRFSLRNARVAHPPLRIVLCLIVPVIGRDCLLVRVAVGVGFVFVA